MAFAITEPAGSNSSHHHHRPPGRQRLDPVRSEGVDLRLDQAQAVLVVGRSEEAKTGNFGRLCSSSQPTPPG